MREPSATAPKHPGWWRFLLALFAFVAIGTVAPIGWRGAIVLVGAATAACVVLAIAVGGRFSGVAAVTAVAGIAVGASMTGPEAAYRLLVLGWAVLLAAGFGIVSLISPAERFLSRALAAIALAMSAGVLGAAMFGGGLERVRGPVYAEMVRRSHAVDMQTQQMFATDGWRDAEGRRPQLAQLRLSYETLIHALPQRIVFLLPSLIALQSLAALALGWGLFHRLSRTRAGPPLAPLREFTFNDQFVWAIAVGATIIMLPEFRDGRAAGVNILLFFSVLFALRGLGVVASFGRHILPFAMLTVAALTALAAFFAPRVLGRAPGEGLLAVAYVAAGIPLLLGLADVWLNVRRRTRPAR